MPASSATHPGFSFGGESVLFAADNVSPNSILWRMQLEGGRHALNDTSSPPRPTRWSLRHRAGRSSSRIRRCRGCRRNHRSGFPSRTAPSPQHRHRWRIAPPSRPSGDKILFLRNWTRRPQKRAAALRHEHQRLATQTELTHNSDDDVADPRWSSPDGKFIVYCLQRRPAARHDRAELRHLAHARRRPAQAVAAHDQTVRTTTAPRSTAPATLSTIRSNRGGQWNVWLIRGRPGGVHGWRGGGRCERGDPFDRGTGTYSCPCLWQLEERPRAWVPYVPIATSRP